MAIEAELELESESESEESSDLVWFNTTEAEIEALLLFEMADGCHVFHSKSRIKGLGMSYVIWPQLFKGRITLSAG